MAETDWQDPEEAPKKRRIPKWVWWGCGGSCLLVTIIGVVVLAVGARFLKEFLDPEKAWAGVREVLPYDERPAGWEARGGTIAGVGQYYLKPPKPAPELVLILRFREPADIDSLFDPESPHNRGVLKIGQIRDPRPGTIELQGREVRCLHFRNWMPDDDDKEESDLPSLRIDVTGTGGVPAVVQINGETDEVTNERAQELLAPFDVWRGK
jgi:hypothetical protein